MSLIVLIEDNEQNARMADKLLRHGGHDVIIAYDGETGLDAVFNAIPDLALVDLGLPDLDGQTVVALLRQEPELMGMPIIAFTAWPAETAEQMAQAYGCDGVITKPIDTRAFLEAINSHLLRT